MSIPSPPPVEVAPPPVPAESQAGTRGFLRSAGLFLLIGLCIYAGLYAWSDGLVRENGVRNRFLVTQRASGQHYDFVILGASHAAVFDYRDMNQRLEQLSGSRIINLATVGGGITVNRFLLDYFLSKATADAVIYVLDSFAFYSDDWNEERMKDAELYLRAPWDAALASRMLRTAETRGMALDYLTGFSKINNPDRFAADLFEAEGSRFDRSYRPIAQIDRQRIEFLYADGASSELLDSLPYLAQLDELISDTAARGMKFILIRPPVPERIRAMLPGEDAFEERVEELAAQHDVSLYDFGRVGNDPSFFYDSDHLNLEGTENFFVDHLVPVLRAEAN